MSVNNITLNRLKERINHLSLTNHLVQSDYTDLFYYHLTSLIKFRLLSTNNDIDQIKLTEKNYVGLEQFIFENTTIVESSSPNNINWDLIDDAKDALNIRIKSILRHEGKSEYLKPIISSTIDSYEKWLIYQQLHPDSKSNPWIPTMQILKNGYLILISDKRDLIEHYQKKIFSNTNKDSIGNIGIVTKSNKKDKFGGFLIDNRTNLQGLIYEYLKREAFGVHNAKSSERISSFLSHQGYNLGYNEIRNRIIIPLKRAGLIGSLTSGFYYIDNEYDLLETFKHHSDKLKGIQRTLDLYKEKGKKMGIAESKFNI